MDYDYLYDIPDIDLPISHVYSPLQPRSSSPSTYELPFPTDRSYREVDDNSDKEEVVIDVDSDADDDENYPGWLYWGIPFDGLLYIGMLFYTCLHTPLFHTVWWVPVIWFYTLFYNLVFYYSLTMELSEEELVEPWMTTWWTVRWGFLWRYLFLLAVALISSNPYERFVYHYVLTTMNSMFVYTLVQSKPTLMKLK